MVQLGKGTKSKLEREMGSRTNLYKKSSFAYKKDLSLPSLLQNLRAYNAATATGEPPRGDDQTASHHHQRKRRRHGDPKSPPRRNTEIDVEDRPMSLSHHDYIEKRRNELSSWQPYEELSSDVLESSSSRLSLVAYESDESSASECEEKRYPTNTGRHDELDRVKSRSVQRFPFSGEPVCVICGKFGEYICNETDDDICSMECKAEILESLKTTKDPLRTQTSDVSSSKLKYTSPMDEIEEKDTWDFDQNRWSKKRSKLCAYECWKCRRPGHLPKDCLVKTCSEAAQGQKQTSTISRDLLELYKRCHQIGRKSSSAKCNACRSLLSLATCLDCNTVLCDNAGHLNEHIRQHASHRQYYSHKLARLVKCCKSTCKITDINNLLACQYCFDKAFDKFYDMYTATWKGSGLSIVAGSICCEDHFEWHRMNCPNAGVEDKAYIILKNTQKHHSVQISDFIF